MSRPEQRSSWRKDLAPPVWLLALDSSTDQTGICLADGDHAAELIWDARRDQTTTLLSAVDQLLTLQHLALSDLSALAVATGPGAFTSLRVGLSTAKGLAYARDLPLIGIPTLDAAARPFAAHGQDVVAALAAGRGRLAWATFGTRDGVWRQVQSPRNGEIEDLLIELRDRESQPLVTGEFDAEQRTRLQRAGVETVPPMLSGRRPAGLAALAWDRLRHGDVDDAATLTPIYLHAGSTGS